MEQVKGVEPSSSAWKADVLAVVRHLQMLIYYISNPKNCQERKMDESLYLLRSKLFIEKILNFFLTSPSGYSIIYKHPVK